MRKPSFAALVLLLEACGSSPGGPATPDAALDASDDGAALDLPDAPGPGVFAACLDGIAPSAGDRVVEVLTFEADDDPAVRVAIARERPVCSYSFMSNYTLVRFALDLDGEQYCITDDASLDYVSTHHNWSDSATATADRAYTVKWLVRDANGPVTGLGLLIDGDSTGAVPLTELSTTTIPADRVCD